MELFRGILIYLLEHRIVSFSWTFCCHHCNPKYDTFVLKLDGKYDYYFCMVTAFVIYSMSYVIDFIISILYIIYIMLPRQWSKSMYYQKSIIGYWASCGGFDLVTILESLGLKRMLKSTIGPYGP